MTHDGGLRASAEPGPEREARAARAEEVAPGGVPQAEVRQQAREQRDVDRVGLAGLLVVA